MGRKPDFSAWATKYNIHCSDGRTIKPGAFKEDVGNGKKVPICWNHNHETTGSVLGYGILSHRDEGVRVDGYFNDTSSGREAKELVKHEDIDHVSIFANRLTQTGPNVTHGVIREVSLVYAGANPGALIDSYLGQSDVSTDEAQIYMPDDICIELYNEGKDTNMVHSEEMSNTNENSGELEHAEEKTVKQVFDSMTDEQKAVFYYLLDQMLNDKNNNEEGDTNMKQSAFDNTSASTSTDFNTGYFAIDVESNERVSLSHDELKDILDEAKRIGSMKEAVLQHGITDIEYLFPDAKNVTQTPTWISRKQNWVAKVIDGAKHLPFSRLKSMHADITMDDARARGYIKGNLKVEEQFSLLKRTTDPHTITKLQKLNRDDVIDITDFDVVRWISAEMDIMLQEELARAALFGDQRAVSSDDHIDPTHIRPIWTDANTYVINKTVEVPANATPKEVVKEFIRQARKARKDYKGSGNLTLFTTEDFLTDALLIEDEIGHLLYDDEQKFARIIRASEVVTVPVMENLTRTVDSKEHTLLGILVNMNDYAFGSDKGGKVTMFDDFDINYNKQVYLKELRTSGALTVPYSAIVIEKVVSGS